MKIAILGSTWFIGKQLLYYLLRSGNELIVISRGDFAGGSNHLAKVIISISISGYFIRNCGTFKKMLNLLFL